MLSNRWDYSYNTSSIAKHCIYITHRYVYIYRVRVWTFAMTRSLQKHCANVTQSKYNNFELAATLELLSLDKCSTIPLPKIYESEPIWIFFWLKQIFFFAEKKRIATIHACRILGKPYADTVSSLQNHYVYWLKSVENFEIHCNFTRLIFICFIFTQSTPFIKQQQKINHAFYRSVYQQ